MAPVSRPAPGPAGARLSTHGRIDETAARLYPAQVRCSRITAVSAHPATGGSVHAYLVHGAVPTLVDAPSPDPEFLDRVDALLRDADDGPLQQLVVTHAHDDHIRGAGALLERWPSCRPLKRTWPARDAASGVAWQTIDGEPLVPAGDDRLWALHTPGHAPDHTCLLDVRSGTLLGGDLVVNGGTVAIAPSQGGNLAYYLTSLRAVLDLQPRRILPAHGDEITQPGSLLRGYISHRLSRERQILELLAAHVSHPEHMAERMYASLDPALLPAARETVLAHLQKLEAEGRANRSEAGWVLRS